VKRLNSGGWGMDTLIGFMVGFVLFLLVVVFLAYRAGAL
jgi:hypothetical protein